MLSQREKVTDGSRARAIALFNDNLKFRLKQKGTTTFASRHEALGVLTEEFNELVDAVKSNNEIEFEQELIDIMVGAYWVLASSINRSMDW